MIVAAASGAAVSGAGRVPGGTALKPVVDLQDRRPIGYEALARPSSAAGTLASVDAALGAAHHVSPAIALVPLSPLLVADATFDPAERARAAGVPPSQVAWILRRSETSALRQATSRRAAELRSKGFLVALDGVDIAVLGEPDTSDLGISFALLDAEMTRRVIEGDRARAEVSALLAFFSRLDGRVVARQVNNAETVRLLVGLGLQFGAGELLGRPLVLDAGIAEPDDEVVTAAWFHDREVRPLGSRGAARPEGSYLGVFTERVAEAPVGDRRFAMTLGETARMLQAEHDRTRILSVVTELLPTVLPVDRLAIFEADWDNHRMRPLVAIGEGMAGLFEMDDSMGTGITGWAFLQGVPYNCPNTDSHVEAAAVPGTYDSDPESLLVIPLIAGDHRLGVLDLWRDGLEQFSEEDVERAALFGYVLAAAWRNAQLYGELERRTMTDTLTGLLNMRWWKELAPREAAQSSRGGSEIGVMMVDLDTFKEVNDRAGHAAGDEALRQVAGILRHAVRSGDAAVRYGGDEFLLVLRDADDRGARRVAETVREGLAALPPPAPGLQPLTASIGFAFYPRDGADLELVLAKADAAMYRAKAEGRNRVVQVSASPDNF